MKHETLDVLNKQLTEVSAICDQINQALDGARSRKAVLMVGMSGEGNSTLGNYLLGSEYAIQRRGSIRRAVTQAKEYFPTGHQTQSQTLLPKAKSLGNKSVLIDLPGFGDTRKEQEQQAVDLVMHLSTKIIHNISAVLLVCSWNTLNQTRMVLYRQVIAEIAARLGHSELLCAKIQLIVSKAPRDLTQTDVAERLEQLSTHEQWDDQDICEHGTSQEICEREWLKMTTSRFIANPDNIIIANLEDQRQREVMLENINIKCRQKPCRTKANNTSQVTGLFSIRRNLGIAARLYTELHENIHLHQSLESAAKKISKKSANIKKQIQTLKSKQFREDHTDKDRIKALTESIELTKGRIYASEQSLAQMRRQQNSFITSMVQMEGTVERLKIDLRQVENRLYQAQTRSQNEARKTQEIDNIRTEEKMKHTSIREKIAYLIHLRILHPYEIALISQKENEIKLEEENLDRRYDTQRDLENQCKREESSIQNQLYQLKQKITDHESQKAHLVTNKRSYETGLTHIQRDLVQLNRTLRQQESQINTLEQQSAQKRNAFEREKELQLIPLAKEHKRLNQEVSELKKRIKETQPKAESDAKTLARYHSVFKQVASLIKIIETCDEYTPSIKAFSSLYKKNMCHYIGSKMKDIAAKTALCVGIFSSIAISAYMATQQSWGV